MRYLSRLRFVNALQAMPVLLAAALLVPQSVRAECKEYRIVEYDDRVEAVCVGEPLTEAQKKANLEEEKRQEAEAARQRGMEIARQKEAAMAEKTRMDTEAAAERKKRSSTPAAAPQQPVSRGTSNPQIIFK